MKRVVFAATALLLGGCASAASTDTSGGITRTTTHVQTGTGNLVLESYVDEGAVVHTVPRAPDRVWEVLPAVYQSLGIPVGTTVPATRTLGNQNLTVVRTLAGSPLSKLVNCGDGATGAPIADSYRVTFSVVTVLEPVANGTTRVRNTVTAKAANPSVSGAPVTCATRGALETQIAQKIRELAAS